MSTDKQAERGGGLQDQQQKIRAMATVHDAELLEIVTDAGESASSIDRPGLKRVLQMVRAGQVNYVYVHKLDRLTRSVRDLGDLLELFKKKNVALVSVTESLDTSSAAGKLVVNIMACVSQWEREAIGERTASVLRCKRDNHEVYNHSPYGFTRDGERLVELPMEQSVIQQIISLRAAGQSLREIAAVLNGEGVPTKQGKRWQPQVISDVLRLHALRLKSPRVEAAA